MRWEPFGTCTVGCGVAYNYELTSLSHPWLWNSDFETLIVCGASWSVWGGSIAVCGSAPLTIGSASANVGGPVFRVLLAFVNRLASLFEPGKTAKRHWSEQNKDPVDSLPQCAHFSKSDDIFVAVKKKVMEEDWVLLNTSWVVAVSCHRSFNLIRWRRS